MLLFSCVAKAQEKSVELLHYNAFKTQKTKTRSYKAQKQKEVSELIRNHKVTIYSILEDGSSKGFIDKGVFRGRAHYALKEVTTASLQHSLYFDKRKVTIKESQSYVSAKALFFYYKLLLKGAEEPVHLIVYKQSLDEHPVQQHQEILNFVNTRNIKAQLLLVGGASLSIAMLEESYIKPAKENIKIINLMSSLKLYDHEYKFVWYDAVDFLYGSKDLWLPNQGAITYKRRNPYLGKDAFFEDNLQGALKNRPFTFCLQLNDAPQNTVYKIPEVEIISQDKTSLLFSVLWDEDVTLSVEIVSMIGNRFLGEDVKYVGVKKEYTVDLSSYPTGIYLLKVNDTKGRMLIRKFTKY